jgi:hypothetical protein
MSEEAGCAEFAGVLPLWRDHLTRVRGLATPTDAVEDQGSSPEMIIEIPHPADAAA